MNFLRQTLLSLCLLTLASVACQAQVLVDRSPFTLNVDQENEEFYFTGTLTGTVRGSVFYTPDPYSAEFREFQRRIRTPGNHQPQRFDITFGIGDGSSDQVSMWILDGESIVIIAQLDPEGEYPGTFSLTGNGVRQDYSTLPLVLQNYLENYDPSAPPAESSTGFSAVQVNLVPEPASGALLVGALGLLALRRRVRA